RYEAMETVRAGDADGVFGLLKGELGGEEVREGRAKAMEGLGYLRRMMDRDRGGRGGGAGGGDGGDDALEKLLERTVTQGEAKNALDNLNKVFADKIMRKLRGEVETGNDASIDSVLAEMELVITREVEFSADSIGEGLAGRMFDNVSLMYARDMVEVDTSVGYVGWLSLTNQQIRPDDEQVYCHGVNYSDKTVETSNRFPFVERRMWNHDDFRSYTDEAFGREQERWEPPEGGWRGREGGAREWKNKTLGPTYDYNILKLKRGWNLPWEPKRHLGYADKFRGAVMTLLLCGGKVGVPGDVVIHIITFFGREWWGTGEGDKGGASPVRCWDRQCCVQKITAGIFARITAERLGGPAPAAGARAPQPLKACKCGVAKYCHKRCRKEHAYEVHGRVCGFSPCRPGLGGDEEDLVRRVEGLDVGETKPWSPPGFGETEDKDEREDRGQVGDEDEDEEEEWESVSEGELSDGGTTFQGVEGKENLTEEEKGEMIERFFRGIYSKTRLPHYNDDSGSSSSSSSSDGDEDDDDDDGDY
ncbi:hypothetical protein TrRE_jg6312, partial [Triparma retinervis]